MNNQKKKQENQEIDGAFPAPEGAHQESVVLFVGVCVCVPRLNTQEERERNEERKEKKKKKRERERDDKEEREEERLVVGGRRLLA